MSTQADEQTVASHFDGICSDRLRWREDAEFDFQRAGFVDCDGMESRVFERGSAGGVNDRAIDRADGQYIAHASTEISTKIQRGERAARFCKVRIWRIELDTALFQRGKYRLVSCF